jgi:hypothetical protein
MICSPFSEISHMKPDAQALIGRVLDALTSDSVKSLPTLALIDSPLGVEGIIVNLWFVDHTHLLLVDHG